MLRTLFVITAFLTLAPAASGEIFRCASPSGLPVYQNFPCGAEAPPSAATPAVVIAAPAPSAPPIKSIQTEAPPAPAARATSVATGSTPLPSEPRVGMRSDEVKAIWGEPSQIVQDEPRSGRVEIWQYDDGRVVEINHKQRVISVTTTVKM